MTPEEDNLGFAGVYASLYSAYVNSPVIPILPWLKAHGLEGLAGCPGCGLLEFQHMDKCPFMATLEPILIGLRQAIEDGGRPDMLMKERQVKKVKLT